MIGFVRVVGGFVFRREAMGSGDIHILGMIGAFLGWQAAVLAFFLAPFFGFIPALWKLSIYLGETAPGSEISQLGPRNPLRALPRPGGPDAAPVLGLELAEDHEILLRPDFRAILVPDRPGALGARRRQGMASAYYKRRRRSLVRNLWVYRRLVALAIVLGLILWFVVTNNQPVSIAFPFGLGPFPSTTGLVILLSVMVGSLATALVLALYWAVRKSRFERDEVPGPGRSAVDDDLPPPDYAAKTGEGAGAGRAVVLTVG